MVQGIEKSNSLLPIQELVEEKSSEKKRVALKSGKRRPKRRLLSSDDEDEYERAADVSLTSSDYSEQEEYSEKIPETEKLLVGNKTEADEANVDEESQPEVLMQDIFDQSLRPRGSITESEVGVQNTGFSPDAISRNTVSQIP